MGFPFGMTSMFDTFGIFFVIILVFIFGVIIFVLAKGLKQWNRNNHSPRLTVPATVVAKRTHVSSSSMGEHHHHHSRTNYYVTFQVDSGDRMELCVNGTDYGMLIEGDRGQLSFQGTRFLGFQRS